MSQCSVIVGAILPAILSLSPSLAAAHDAAPEVMAAGAHQVRHHADFPLDGIVGLKADRVLLWSSTGQMQVGTAAGQWTPVFRAPLQPVNDVAPDAAGILAAASVDVGISRVVLLDATGREQLRWTLKEQVFRLLTGEHSRFVTTRAGIVPLLADGTTGPLAPYLEPATPFDTLPPGPLATPPDILRFAPGGGATGDPPSMIACRARDLSMLHHAPGRCWQSGPDGWKVRGDFARPIACGDWLIVVEDGHRAHVTAYAMASGKPEMKITTTTSPQVACPSPGELLIADRRLMLFKLPADRPTWTSQAMRAPIIDVAATETAFAYRLRGSFDVVIMLRPPRR